MHAKLNTHPGRSSVVLLVLVAFVAVLAIPAFASAGVDNVDADGNGYIDALVREYNPLYASLFAYPNVGASCDHYWTPAAGYTNRITIRPPEMWPLNGLASQTVAWRPMLYSTTHPNSNYAGDWVYDTARANQPAEFGGGGDGRTATTSVGTSLGSVPGYYNGAVATMTNEGGWIPYVQVAWLNPANNTWSFRPLQVKWVLADRLYYAQTDQSTC
ncbi:MAG: hypothetical protein QOH95_2811 [Gaiellaceae bacterium]|jgi:hypothetical protein|nr:hypothetical protein [Gaiellaceae bacterium]